MYGRVSYPGTIQGTDLHLKASLTQEQTQADEKAALTPDAGSNPHFPLTALETATIQVGKRAPRGAGIWNWTEPCKMRTCYVPVKSIAFSYSWAIIF